MYECMYIFTHSHEHIYTHKLHSNMASYTKKFFQSFYNKLGKNVSLDSTNKVIANVTQKTKAEFTNKIENSMILQEMRNVPLKLHSPLPKRLIRWWQWYQHLVGLHIVENAKQEVILVQNKLMKCREIRRDLRQEAFENSNKIKDVYEELLRIRRDDPKYVTLTVLENKLLQEQSKGNAQLNLLDEEEREYFMQLTTAINEYQDAQTSNAQKYKYISIVASVVAALISLISSTIYNNRRIESINESIEELQEKNNVVIVNHCNSLKEHIDTKLSQIGTNVTSGDSYMTTANSYLRWAASYLYWSTNKEEKTVTQTAVPETAPAEKAGWSNVIKKTAYGFGIALIILACI